MKIAELFKELELCATFYFHVRKNSYEKDCMKAISDTGHEIGYHHECLDRCRGDFAAAKELFIRTVDTFRKDGFDIKTVCSHGELGIVRNGYTHNYDLFKKFSDLLKNQSLEEANFLYGKFNNIYVSDTFRTYGNFYKTIEKSFNDGRALVMVIHSHRRHKLMLFSYTTVVRDLLQCYKNKILKYRKYDTVINSSGSH